MIKVMSRFSLLVLCVLILQTESLDPSKCQQLPQDKHCLIEYSAQDRWPHTRRYVYNWSTKSCFEIRWSNHCPAVPVPTDTNNFPSEMLCLDECGGWA